MRVCPKRQSHDLWDWTLAQFLNISTSGSHVDIYHVASPLSRHFVLIFILHQLNCLLAILLPPHIIYMYTYPPLIENIKNIHNIFTQILTTYRC